MICSLVDVYRMAPETKPAEGPSLAEAATAVLQSRQASEASSQELVSGQALQALDLALRTAGPQPVRDGGGDRSDKHPRQVVLTQAAAGALREAIALADHDFQASLWAGRALEIIGALQAHFARSEPPALGAGPLIGLLESQAARELSSYLTLVLLGQQQRGAAEDPEAWLRFLRLGVWDQFAELGDPDE
jgi:hypothetical protein